MNSKIDALAAWRLRWRLTPISLLRVETKLSEMALSSADPTLLIDGTIPACSNLLPNERAVYCAPRSLWWMSPAEGFLLLIAISRAAATSSVRRWLAIDQPTTFLE